jgi:pilus assembly protein CpaD
MRMTAFSVRRDAARAGFGVAALALLAALSAGCSPVATTSQARFDADYHLRHPIVISDEPEVLDMPIGMSGPALSPEIEVAIRDYVREYRSHGTGSITIQVPTGSANEVAAASTGHAVHYALVRAGVPRGHIRVAPYPVGDHAEMASLRLSYLRVKAVTPECGVWPDVGPASQQNYDFGCASQQNLAAMVADPADLLRPRPMTPADGARRAETIRTYEATGNTGWQPQPRQDLTGSVISGSF